MMYPSAAFAKLPEQQMLEAKPVGLRYTAPFGPWNGHSTPRAAMSADIRCSGGVRSRWAIGPVVNPSCSKKPINGASSTPEEASAVLMYSRRTCHICLYVSDRRNWKPAWVTDPLLSPISPAFLSSFAMPSFRSSMYDGAEGRLLESPRRNNSRVSHCLVLYLATSAVDGAIPKMDFGGDPMPECLAHSAS
eukprot:CAMPEP_0117654988 /NCGR_PEP_ID=MMETSP0804-20121206/4040_1 /TAXON_ID=1074897 /ORGANISM="Tetraselmis astigmatica, Strain CCMP880" /LENGTH=190 /DNA_ID=CAMNT_0005461311 /DNA_START=787 /DNA_END=1359 /DNA_ORIENTATION=+